MNDATQFFNTSGSYEISRSLRFNSADSAHLSRNSASAGNRKTWTWSGWVKKSTQNIANNEYLFETRSGSSDSTIFSLGFANGGFGTTKDALTIFRYSFYNLITTQLFRDTSAWYHIVLVADTTQATASNRLKLYVNGTQVTSFSTAVYPSLNEDLPINTTNAHVIGGLSYLNACLAEIYFIDSQALTPSSFGMFDANNVWQPKAYTGSYGTNGFHLDFADNSAATATTLGKDTSGNGNNWTPNNLSVTAGAGNDSLVDSPTNYGTDTGAGGTVRGNYCTLNPLGLGGGTLSNGNLTVSTSSPTPAVGTFAMTSGKWYWEVTLTTAANPRVGVYNIGAASPANLGGTANGWAIINAPSRVYHNGATTSYGSFSGASGNIVMVAYDADLGRIWYGENGTWFASGNPATNSNPSQTSVTGTAIVPASSSGLGSNVHDCNFGQRSFSYQAPSGFKALCTANLPTPTITKPRTVMDVVTYTGTGSTLTPTSTLGFSPDLVWIKSRSSVTDHALYDAVRGAQARLESNTTDAEVTSDNGLTAFNSNGFTLGTQAEVNYNAATYAGWCWDAGSSTVANTAGSISSQVRANASAGFSVVTFTGTGANATIGHGLGVAPQMAIVKRRNTTGDWAVWHTGIAATNYLILNSGAAEASGATYWNSTSPTSTVFSVGTATNTNANTGTYVSYCFAPVAGYSAFGRYTGNGQTETSGPFIYCGFRPRFVLIKKTSSTDNWKIFDSVRDTYNVTDKSLQADKSAAENVGEGYNKVDILSNGFAIRVANASYGLNTNDTFIYAAFAESPFALARAR